MIIQITKRSDHVEAMGHRVAMDQGGIAELKRRCLETLSRRDDPPDTVEFRRLWELRADAAPAAPVPAGQPVVTPPPPAKKAQGKR